MVMQKKCNKISEVTTNFFRCTSTSDKYSVFCMMSVNPLGPSVVIFSLTVKVKIKGIQGQILESLA